MHGQTDNNNNNAIALSPGESPTSRPTADCARTDNHNDDTVVAATSPAGNNNDDTIASSPSESSHLTANR